MGKNKKEYVVSVDVNFTACFDLKAVSDSKAKTQGVIFAEELMKQLLRQKFGDYTDLTVDIDYIEEQ